MTGEAKPKKVNHRIIERGKDPNDVPQVYRIMDELVSAHHHHLLEADIVIAWRYGWNEDADGGLRLGQCKKASDLDRDLHNYDFIILLNFEAVNAAAFTDTQLRALIDHELCHAQVTTDDTGDYKRDEHGKVVWRIRKHDIEEFQEVVARHGLYKSDLESFARVAMEKADAPLMAQTDAA